MIRRIVNPSKALSFFMFGGHYTKFTKMTVNLSRLNSQKNIGQLSVIADIN